MLPILWQIGPFSLNSLWTMLTLGLIIALLLFLKTVKRQRLNLDIFLKNWPALLLSTLITARICFLIRYWQFYAYSEHPFLSLFYLWDKGLSFWGGLTGFLIAFFFLAYQRKEKLSQWADLLIKPILILIIFGSIGNFLAGQSYGSATSLPWGIAFSSPNVKYTVPIHPTQIYRLIYTLLILVLLPIITGKLAFLKKPGNLALSTVFLYTFFRFVEEFFRGDDDIFLLFFRLNHVITFLLILLSGTLLYKQYQKWRIS